MGLRDIYNKYYCVMGVLIFLFTTRADAVVKQHYGDLSFRYNDIDNVSSVKGNNWWADLNYLYHFHQPFVDREGKFDFAFRYNDAGGSMYSVKELQMTMLSRNLELSFGRLLVDWVEIDKVWGLGKINNRVNFDYFDPGQEGLTGLRAKYSINKYFMVDLFASFLYVPEFNPSLKIDKDAGTISSRNPWAQAPASVITSGNLNSGTPTRVVYDVDIPDTEDVVLQDSIGLNLRFSPTEFAHLTIFYLHKPENNLSNSATLDLVSENSLLIPHVAVKTGLFDHQLWGGQITSVSKDKSLHLYASYYESKPGKKPEASLGNTLTPADLGVSFEVEKQNEEYFGTGFHWFFPRGKMSLGYLSRISDFDRTSILAKKPRWSQAINFAVKYNFRNYVLLTADIKYDTLTFDRLYMLDMTLKLHRFWQLSMGANIIGTPYNGEGFWVPFRANDSLYGQLSYLF